MIYKHTDYMKECGIDMDVIMRTIRLLAMLQDITATLKK
jgi:hypothetical protein